MNKLLIAISNLVKGQEISITVDDYDNYVFRLSTSFGVDAKPFWVISNHSMTLIKYHFEEKDLDEYIAKVIDHLIISMDDAVLNHEPELR